MKGRSSNETSVQVGRLVGWSNAHRFCSVNKEEMGEVVLTGSCFLFFARGLHKRDGWRSSIVVTRGCLGDALRLEEGKNRRSDGREQATIVAVSGVLGLHFSPISLSIEEGEQRKKMFWGYWVAYLDNPMYVRQL